MNGNNKEEAEGEINLRTLEIEIMTLGRNSKTMWQSGCGKNMEKYVWKITVVVQYYVWPDMDQWRSVEQINIQIDN